MQLSKYLERTLRTTVLQALKIQDYLWRRRHHRQQRLPLRRHRWHHERCHRKVLHAPSRQRLLEVCWRGYDLRSGIWHIIIEQEEIARWTGVEGNGSIHDGDGTMGHGLTMDIGKGLSICERTCYACIACLDPKASEQEEGKQFT